MAEISNRPWSGFSASDYSSPESYCSASLIDENPAGQRKTKALCHLPVKEPGGALNRNGVHAAAGRLMQTDAKSESKRRAARKLVQLYAELQEDPPESVRRMAQG